ncbi:hypothetical protein BBJ28_00026517 [Nothophytophthora sp. Chile5]|nr:hypothetical protein BBJ28_00026517 [Nothophytophthora sp. Chile5]
MPEYDGKPTLRQQKKRRASSVPGTESDRSDRPNSPAESQLNASENENEVSSDYTTPKPRRQAAVLAADAMVAVATMEESETQPGLEMELDDQFDAGFSSSHDDEAADEFESEAGENQDLRGLEPRNRSDGVAAVPEMLSGVVTLRFATDESFPEVRV